MNGPNLSGIPDDLLRMPDNAALRSKAAARLARWLGDHDIYPTQEQLDAERDRRSTSC